MRAPRKEASTRQDRPRLWRRGLFWLSPALFAFSMFLPTLWPSGMMRSTIHGWEAFVISFCCGVVGGILPNVLFLGALVALAQSRGGDRPLTWARGLSVGSVVAALPLLMAYKLGAAPGFWFWILSFGVLTLVAFVVTPRSLLETVNVTLGPRPPAKAPARGLPKRRVVVQQQQKCPLCRSTLGNAEALAVCPRCETVYHNDCCRELGGCATYGCVKEPAHARAVAVTASAV